MRTRHFVLALLCVSISGVSCCTGEQKSKTFNSRVLFDHELGKLETDILEKYGKPAETRTTRVKDLKDELRAPLNLKVSSGEVLVKELYYKLPKKERIFWLTVQKEGWRVISDVEIPEGTVF